MGMSFADMLDASRREAEKARKRPDDEEHRLQVACVRWFRLQYPGMAKSLIAVPNGGRRDEVTGAKLKAEGVVAGVADLLLLEARGGYAGLAIEMKTEKGRQSRSQEEWQRYITGRGWDYVVVRSLEQFMAVVKDYLLV